MKRPNKFDWFIYRLFRWYWNPLLAQNGGLLAKALMSEMKKWIERNGKSPDAGSKYEKAA